MTLLGHDVVPLVKRVVKETFDDNLLGLASETAWSFFFGLFPTVLFSLSLLSLFGDSYEIIPAFVERVSGTMPSDAVSMVSRVIAEIVDTDSAPGLISVGLFFALWSGSSVFTTLMMALNRAYEVTETRPWWKQRLIAIGCTISGVIIVWFSTTIMVGGEQITQFVIRTLRLGPAEGITLAVVQYTLALSLLAAFMWMLYQVLPNGKQSRKISLIGALTATVLWMAFTLVFRFYVQNFGAYNKAYGAIGAVMVLLTWMYWTMFVILLGGELNAELEPSDGEQSPPPTKAAST